MGYSKDPNKVDKVELFARGIAKQYNKLIRGRKTEAYSDDEFHANTGGIPL